MNGRDLDSDRARVERVGRRILKVFNQVDENSEISAQKKYLSIIVDTSGAPKLESAEERESVSAELLGLIEDLNRDYKNVCPPLTFVSLYNIILPFSSFGQVPLSFQVLFADFGSPASVAAAAASLREIASSPAGDKFAPTFISKWSKINSEAPKPVYSNVRSTYMSLINQLLCFSHEYFINVIGGKAVAFRDRVRFHTRPLSDRLIGGGMAAAGGGLGQAGRQVRGPR